MLGRRYYPTLIIACYLAAYILVGWQYNPKTAIINFGQTRLSAIKASSEEQRIRGLGGRPALAKNQAMLFVFEKADKYCFWMKDMRFAIDIIWLDDDGRVLKILDNTQPDSYPQSFCPAQPASYVIETVANLTVQENVRVGSLIEINL